MIDITVSIPALLDEIEELEQQLDEAIQRNTELLMEIQSLRENMREGRRL